MYSTLKIYLRNFWYYSVNTMNSEARVIERLLGFCCVMPGLIQTKIKWNKISLLSLSTTSLSVVIIPVKMCSTYTQNERKREKKTKLSHCVYPQLFTCCEYHFTQLFCHQILMFGKCFYEVKRFHDTKLKIR